MLNFDIQIMVRSYNSISKSILISCSSSITVAAVDAAAAKTNIIRNNISRPEMFKENNKVSSKT